jgi:hypothetical protein
MTGDDVTPGLTEQGSDGLWYTVYPDLVEVSAYAPGTAATSEQRQAGDALVESTRLALEGLVTVDDALGAGFEPHPSIDEFHLLHPDYIADNIRLDPTRPEFLVIDPDARLVLGAMFVWPPDGHGPQIAGPASVWHFHPASTANDDFQCWDGLLPIAGVYDAASNQCRQGELRDRSPEMLHVWHTGNPQDPFASKMPTRR